MRSIWFDKFRNYIVFAVILIFSLLGLEISYRIYLGLSEKMTGNIIKFDELLKKAWFLPHPNLIYTFKPNNKFVMNAYSGGTFTINNYGFRSTLEYDITGTAKGPGTIRIATLGGSTAMGVNNDNKIWPYLVGKNLDTSLQDKKIEVLNEAIMGYTSLDNLIDLSIRVIDFNCDIYILYLGINDYLTRAPLAIYRTDYSHFRKTLWENLSFSFIELIPDWLLRSKVVTNTLFLLGAPDRKNLLDNTGTIHFRKRFEIMNMELPVIDNKIKNTVIRNVASMVGIIRSHNPDALILLSSFYHLENPVFIRDLNVAFKGYASGAGIIFIDAAKKIPHIQKMVFDYGHFTKEGDENMARIFSEAIIERLTKPDNSLKAKE